jgi:hypothetical protein
VAGKPPPRETLKKARRKGRAELLTWRTQQTRPRAATGNCVLNSGTTPICSTSRSNKNTFNPKPWGASRDSAIDALLNGGAQWRQTKNPARAPTYPHFMGRSVKPPRETLRASPNKLLPNCGRGGHRSGSVETYSPHQRDRQTTNELRLIGADRTGEQIVRCP